MYFYVHISKNRGGRHICKESECSSMCIDVTATTFVGCMQPTLWVYYICVDICIYIVAAAYMSTQIKTVLQHIQHFQEQGVFETGVNNLSWQQINLV